MGSGPWDVLTWSLTRCATPDKRCFLGGPPPPSRPTALVHEAFVRLAEAEPILINNRVRVKGVLDSMHRRAYTMTRVGGVG
jgi:hypothetical protein